VYFKSFAAGKITTKVIQSHREWRMSLPDSVAILYRFWDERRRDHRRKSDGCNSGDAEADPEGLVEARARSTAKGLGRGQSPSPKMNFELEMACFGELRATFCESLGDSLH